MFHCDCHLLALSNQSIDFSCFLVAISLKRVKVVHLVTYEVMKVKLYSHFLTVIDNVACAVYLYRSKIIRRSLKNWNFRIVAA